MCSVVVGLIQVLGITYLNLSVTQNFTRSNAMSFPHSARLMVNAKVSYVTYFSYITRDVN